LIQLKEGLTFAVKAEAGKKNLKPLPEIIGF
jgi:hypothetical protein